MARYADSPTVEVETLVEASPEVVWPLVCDIDLPARFSSEFQGASWLDGADGPALDARFKGRNRHEARGDWEATCTVRWYEPERSFGWAVSDVESPAASWRFGLEPTDEGTRLTFRAQLGPGPSGLTAVIEAMPDKEERIVENRLNEWRENMEATVAGIRSLAETAG